MNKNLQLVTIIVSLFFFGYSANAQKKWEVTVEKENGKNIFRKMKNFSDQNSNPLGKGVDLQIEFNCKNPASCSEVKASLLTGNPLRQIDLQPVTLGTAKKATFLIKNSTIDPKIGGKIKINLGGENGEE